MKRSHGGGATEYLERHHPAAPKPWIDLSTGINPWPYPVSHLSDGSWSRLPEAAAERSCRAALAGYLASSPDRIVLTPGSQSAISLLPSLFALGSVGIVEPTYNEHRRAWLSAGHVVAGLVFEEIEQAQHDVLLLADPNNPDGRVIGDTRLVALAERCSARGQWLIVDQAFADLLPDAGADRYDGLNVVLLRSFGKFFGLAGLRLGAVLGPKSIIGQIEERLGPWAVSGPALEIGRRAYADRDWQSAARLRLRSAAQVLNLLLEHAGLRHLGGTDLFQLAAHEKASALFEALAADGLYVRRFERDRSWLRFGLPPTEEARARLASALLRWRPS